MFSLFFSPPGPIKNGFRGETDTSDDEVVSDVLSHCSSASESASAVEENSGVCPVLETFRSCTKEESRCITLPVETGVREVDEQTEQEDMEDKLKQCIDNLMDKRLV